MYGAGFAFGVGLVSGLVLAGVFLAVYLLMQQKVPSDQSLEEATTRAQALVDRLKAQTTKTRGATEALQRIEPGE